MLKLIRERISCDLKRVARYENKILFVELFGRQQIIKSLSASLLERREDFIISGKGRIESIYTDRFSKYKRKILPLNDGYCHCIAWPDDLFSERFIIAQNIGDRTRAFQIWLSKISLPIPLKANQIFVDSLFEEINYSLNWDYMEVENKIEEESLSFCCMDFLIQQEYAELVEAVESVFADFKFNQKIA